MESSQLAAALQTVINKSVDGKKVYGASFALQNDSFSWAGSAGDIATAQQYFIASTTKLFTTAIILQLRNEGKLNLKDRISTYLDSSIWMGIHHLKGKEYSQELTIQHLLAHTSGLPDYFQDKGKNGKSLEEELVAGKDQYWSFEMAMERTRNMESLFIPGSKGKAHYSDANFQLLGKIIESITGEDYASNCKKRIIDPLGLQHTYLYDDAKDSLPKHLYYGTSPLPIPLAMTSFGADGGMVSNSADMLVFIQAFFKGTLFPEHYISELQEWNRIFSPMQSGVGIHLFKLPWLFNPTGAVPYFIGHSGLSGALAYYSPKENLFIVGTVNQVAHPDLSFRTMIKLALEVKKRS
jgi:D-alanyl-D-alanine carboxypeptidase